MSASGGWRERIVNTPPIKLINRGFALLIAVLLTQTVVASLQTVRDIRKIPKKAAENILAITQYETDYILTIMDNPSEIFTVRPLLEAVFRDLKERDRITSQVIQSEAKELPEGLRSTPEKVEYWIDHYTGENRISPETGSEIRQFFPYLKAREVGENLKIILPQDEFDKRTDEIKAKYTQFISEPIVDIYFDIQGGLINVYAALKREHENCTGCHGYLGNRPVLVHFKKDVMPEITEERKKGLIQLLLRALILAIIIVFYLLSYFLLRSSLMKREAQREKMEKALEASVDVLKSLRSSPRLMPFFVSSPSCLLSAASGGGDSVHWHDYRFRYAGYCLHDVSGHDIQETLLNIYATAVAGGCKINMSNKQVATPAYFLANLNRKVHQFCSQIPAYSSHFLTVIKVLMDFTMKKLIISLAGHPKPLLIRPDGSYDWAGEEGLLLGQFDIEPGSDYGFVDTTVWLGEGETLLVYSDGLMEQKNRDGVMFSAILEEKVVPKLAGKEPDEAYALLQSELETHLAGVVQEDDITFTFFGARPTSRYETCQYLFLDKKSKSSAEGGQPGDIARGLDYDGKGSEEVFKPEFVYDRILDAIRSYDWHENTINDIKHAMNEVLTKIVDKDAENGGERQISVGYVVHDDVLEIEINCINRCFNEEMISKGSSDLLANRYGSSLLVTKAVAEEIYFCESGDTCWLLFKKNRPEGGHLAGGGN